VSFEVNVWTSVLAFAEGTGEVVVTTRETEAHATNSIGAMANASHLIVMNSRMTSLR
jgi:hypothetical protein